MVADFGKLQCSLISIRIVDLCQRMSDLSLRDPVMHGDTVLDLPFKVVTKTGYACGWEEIIQTMLSTHHIWAAHVLFGIYLHTQPKDIHKLLGIFESMPAEDEDTMYRLVEISMLVTFMRHWTNEAQWQEKAQIWKDRFQRAIDQGDAVIAGTESALLKESSAYQELQLLVEMHLDIHPTASPFREASINPRGASKSLQRVQRTAMDSEDYMFALFISEEFTHALPVSWMERTGVHPQAILAWHVNAEAPTQPLLTQESLQDLDAELRVSRRTEGSSNPNPPFASLPGSGNEEAQYELHAGMEPSASNKRLSPSAIQTQGDVHPVAATTSSISALAPRASENRAGDWHRALISSDDDLLTTLADSEPPGVALFEMETYINGIYRNYDVLTRMGFDLGGSLAEEKAESKDHETGESASGDIGSTLKRAQHFAERTLSHIKRVRGRLGYGVYQFDLQLLRLMRRSSALSPVLGAGVSMGRGCGAPSWSGLVRELLSITLERGLEVSRPRKEDVSRMPEHVHTFLEREGFAPPPGTSGETIDTPEVTAHEQPEHTESSSSQTLRFQMERIKEYSEDERMKAQRIIDAIDSREADNDLLMEGANLVYELCGQNLFTLITGILYEGKRQPSAVHQAIARLAHAQRVPDRQQGGYLSGWDAIISYNFDNFMSIALEEEGVPSAAWAMRGEELAGDPNPMAIRLGQVPCLQSVLHLHGYTPRKLFLITHVRFVFAASQYKDTYHGQKAEVFRRFVEEHLQNPVHICLYIGCSFTDKYMNQLLQEAFEKWPGRYHYALLEWPGDHKDGDRDQRKAEEEYLKMGIRPIWFHSYDEIPHIIARLE